MISPEEHSDHMHKQSKQNTVQSFTEKVANAESTQALLTVIDEIQHSQGNHSSRLSSIRMPATIIGAIALIIVVGIIADFDIMPMGITALVLGILIIIQQRAPKNALNQLSKTIFQKQLLLVNQLSTSETDHVLFSLGALSTRFDEFTMGDSNRRLQTIAHGHFSGDTLSFNYHYFHFSYHLWEKQNKHSNSDAEKLTRHQRYGLIIDLAKQSSAQFPKLQKGDYYQVMTQKPDSAKKLFEIPTYMPASLAFREQFFIMTNQDDHFSAKRLKPAVVVILESMNEQYQDLMIELNDANELKISFTSPSLLNPDSVKMNNQSRYNLSQPDAFKSELLAQSSSSALQSLLLTTERLLQEWDQNF